MPDWMGWDLASEVKNKVKGLFNRSVYRDVPQDDIRAVEDRVGRDELAFLMADTRDKKSRAYKSARDRLTKIRSGKVRTPKASTVNSANRAAMRKRTSEIKERGSTRISFVADVKTSRTTWANGKVAATLSGSALEEFTNALDAGDQEKALMVVCDEYGLDPDYVETLEDVKNLHME